MTIRRCDVGLVSRDGSLADFYATVFELTRLEPLQFPQGTVHRMECAGSVLKVMVPSAPPGPPAPQEHFWDTTGWRYATMLVTDVAEVVERALAHGGTVVVEPRELRPGVSIAVVLDPDGNAVEVMQEGS